MELFSAISDSQAQLIAGGSDDNFGQGVKLALQLAREDDMTPSEYAQAYFGVKNFGQVVKQFNPSND